MGRRKSKTSRNVEVKSSDYFDKKLDFKAITDARKLPRMYYVIPEFASEQTIENIDAKLRGRGRKVKRPLNLVEFKRSYSEFCVEIERTEGHD